MRNTYLLFISHQSVARCYSSLSGLRQDARVPIKSYVFQLSLVKVGWPLGHGWISRFPISIGTSCHRLRGLNNRHLLFIVLGSEMSRPTDLVSGEGPIRHSHMAVFLLCLQVAGEARELSGVSFISTLMLFMT